jgi:hypothetical protein
LDTSQKPEVLEMLEADTIAKLQEAGIPTLRNADELQKAGGSRLVVTVTADRPNGFNYPVVTEVKLLQTVRLVRDPSLEYEAVTWSQQGVGQPLEISRIRRLVANHLDHFIQDYQSVNSKQAVRASNEKPKD